MPPTSHSSNFKLGVFYMLGASLCFAIMNAIVKAASVRLHVAEVGFFRALVTLVILTPWLYYKHLPIFGHSHALLFARGAMGFLSLLLGFYSISKIALADVTMLWKTSVLFTAFLSVVLLRERVTKELLLYILISFVGASLIIKPSFQILNVPGLAALSAGLIVGFIAISLRHLNKTEHSLTIVWAFSFYATILPLIFFNTYFVVPTASESWLLLLMGLVGSIGQIFFTYAFRYAEAAKVQSFAFSEGVFAAFLGWGWWGEMPDVYSLVA